MNTKTLPPKLARFVAATVAHLRGAMEMAPRRPTEVILRSNMTKQYWHYLMSGKHDFTMSTLHRLAEAADLEVVILFRPKQ